MSTATRLYAGLVPFGSLLAPALSTPAVVGLASGSLDTTEKALLVTALLVIVLVVVSRVRRLSEEDRQGGGRQQDQARRHEYWERRGRDERDDSGQDDQSAVLGGQGGGRDRGFEIEKAPPETDLDLHLEHLRAELDEDDSVELETLAEVAEQTDGSPVPRRCPQPHCDAAWTEPGILDIKNGRYEQLDDGRIQCLECEAVVDLD